MDLQSLIQAWDGLGVVTRFDRPTGAWMFIALHDSTLGRPTGGTRMRIYDAPAAGLYDAMHLAEGMTHKWAVAGLPYGGGKAVLAVPGPLEGQEREGLLSRYGRLIDALGGGFATGEDLGTTPEDMDVIGRQTRHVIGVARDGDITDPGPFTSHGVFISLQVALRHAFGSDDLAGRKVLIQGVGDVGAPLARRLAAAGARVLLCDVSETRLTALKAELEGNGAQVAVVAPEAVYDTDCDVYAPCAVGFTLSRQTIPRLRCKVVNGSANNQLAEHDAADLLHRRGILYSPDYVANSGGAIAFGWMEQGEQDREALLARVDRIAETLEEIFAEAAERNESPLTAARRRVERMLAASGDP